MLVLITGGAGFIGSHLTDLLISQGHEVVVLDNLDPQVHGESKTWPSYLPPRKGLVRILGDVRNQADIRKALCPAGVKVDAVVHLAAKVGVGQGQYQISDYYSVNVGGTAILLQEMLRMGQEDSGEISPRLIPRLFVAGSMSAYGEGLYMMEDGDGSYQARGELREPEDMEAGRWELFGGNGVPIGVTENDDLRPASFYASTKAEQERMALIFGATYGVPVWVGRFFNVYGTRQALSNPYTGVVAIFSNQIRAGERPTIYEDGNQTRDFVNVQDLARAVSLLIQGRPSSAGVYNIGTGKATSILEVAKAIGQILGVEVQPKVTGRFRSGDVRHCFSDSSKLQALGWKPQVQLQSGLEVLFDWLQRQEARPGLQAEAHREMADLGLIS